MRIESRYGKEEGKKSITAFKTLFSDFRIQAAKLLLSPTNCYLPDHGHPQVSQRVASFAFCLSLGMPLKKTFIWMKKTVYGPWMRLTGSYSNVTLASPIWAKRSWPSLNIAVLQNHMASNVKCARTKTRCKIWEKFCSEPCRIKQ